MLTIKQSSFSNIMNYQKVNLLIIMTSHWDEKESCREKTNHFKSRTSLQSNAFDFI